MDVKKFLGCLQQPLTLDFVTVRFTTTEHLSIGVDFGPSREIEDKSEGAFTEAQQVVATKSVKLHVASNKGRCETVFGEDVGILLRRPCRMIWKMTATFFVDRQAEVLTTIVIDMVAFENFRCWAG